jgi:uracil-DNA glycosylase family 4
MTTKSKKSPDSDLLTILQDARSCQVCSPHLRLGPRPLLAASSESQILLVGQAPGRVAHASGVPWSDRSGDRLRDWLGVSRGDFYDPRCFAIIPMGFCYPGKGERGDLAPRAECAPLWHQKLFQSIRSVKLTIYLGRYAFEHYLGDSYDSLTLAAKDFKKLLPTHMVIPHPSPRNAIWVKKHAWFEAKLLPALQASIATILAHGRAEL